ncbi:redox-sensing transcriptional repressor Rex [Holophaga foetida]|uniref:redox-sensing transcriptional repressor Rex n=1 Tax=Holophaga foetida TaxID=35839 RepID=UPI0002474D05|nr:redox-sensing transcriptional repressor Rex [Holophaga foetida]
MAYGYKIGSIPLTTVQRFASYLPALRDMQRQGRSVVSSASLAEMLRLEAIQVRKDFGYLGITGRPKTGFQVDDLIGAMEHGLSWNRVSDAILVGTGHLGTALLNYRGFGYHGLAIKAAFDIAPDRVGALINGVQVQHLDEMKPFMDAKMAILTVSPESAQEVALRLVRAGITGIWNFTGRTLLLPEPIVVQDQDIAIGLAVLSAKLTARAREAIEAESKPPA